MKIAIDASRANVKQRTGVENYAFFVIQNLKKIIGPESGHEVILYARESLQGGLAKLPTNWKAKTLRAPFNKFWTQVRLSLEMLFSRPDVLFVPGHVLPFICPKKSVVVVHDVAAMRFSESYSGFERWYNKFSVKFALKRANTIIVPSNFTKREIEIFFDAKHRAEIVVVAEGFDHENFYPELSAEKVGEVLRRLKVQQPYLFFVGRLEEKKDVVTLVKAYEKVCEYLGVELQLVLGGKSGYGYEKIQNVISQSKFKNNIKELGWVSDDDLPCLYKEAKVFCFATKYEGFGLPVLEALGCGTPVIARQGSACEEIAKDYVTLVDDSVESLVDAILEILQKDFKLDFSKIIHEKFSWEKTSEQIARILQG